MVSTMWYHSISGTKGRTTPMLVANAWTVATSRTISRNNRGRNHQRTIANDKIHSNARTLFNGGTTKATSFSEDFATRIWSSPSKSSHRLFLSTTTVDGDCESTSDTAKLSKTATLIATTPSSTNVEDWKDSTLVNPTIIFETLLVPNSQLTKWVTHPDLQHRLAKPDNWELLKHVHPRIKLVQDYDNKKYKQLLLLPSSISQQAASNHTATGIVSSERTNGDDDYQDAWLSELLSVEREDDNDGAASIQKGPFLPMSISSNQLSFQYILRRLLPESALPLPSSYEQIGHVAHFNLKEKHLPFKHLIGSALLESNSGDSIQTVVNKVGKVDGKFRTYECEILANEFQSNNSNTENTEDDTSSILETTVVEDGISIELNVAECYWCTRLSGERKELIKDMMKGRKRPKSHEVAPPLVVADVFCGAGAVCMLLAKKIKDQDKSWKPEEEQPIGTKQRQEHPSLTVLANDWNPKAIEYMKRSIVTNGMNKEQDESEHHKFKLSCRDSYDFISELGEEQQTMKMMNPRIQKKIRKKYPGKTKESPTKDPKPQPPLMPDHVLMNFPLEAPQFLGAIRWWSWKRLRDEGIRRTTHSQKKGSTWSPRFHVYTFARSSSPRADDEEEMAVNLVANELLPKTFFDNDESVLESDATTDDSPDSTALAPSYRRDELNDEFGTEFSTRLVRDVAPGKVVVCVSFSVTPKLIRYMQGDYS